jgi:ABC-type nitrate/sulfonate/bicarbonate transport system ATPase subunit
MVSHSIEDAVFLSDKVIVVSGKPLEVTRSFRINLARKERQRTSAILREEEIAISKVLLQLGEL